MVRDVMNGPAIYDPLRCATRHWWTNWAIVGLGGAMGLVAALTLYAADLAGAARGEAAAAMRQQETAAAAASAERRAIAEQLERIERRLETQEAVLRELLRGARNP